MKTVISILFNSLYLLNIIYFNDLKTRSIYIGEKKIRIHAYTIYNQYTHLQTRCLVNETPLRSCKFPIYFFGIDLIQNTEKRK